jgi:hypothetical protein
MSEVCALLNSALIKACRLVGRPDQVGTGIRAIFCNWHELGKVPPQIGNDKPIRQRFDLAIAQVTEQVGTKSGPSEDQVRTWSQLTAEQRGLLTKMPAEHAITEFMDLAQHVNRTKFRDQCLTPLLEHGLVTMTIPDKPQSSKQRYRLTERGTAVLAGQQQKDTAP